MKYLLGPSKLIIIALVPLILSIGIVSVLPFANADEKVPEWVQKTAAWWAEGKVSTEEYLASLEWLSSEGIIQVTSEIDTSNDNLIVSADEMIKQLEVESSIPFQKEKYEKEGSIVTSPSSFDKNNTAQSYIVRISGGEFKSPLTFKTFSKVDPGDSPNYIKSFSDIGFTTYLLLESLPNKDNSEFYKIVEDYLSPGPEPELFDTSIDILTGDGFILVTANYKKCKITGYTPYTQEFLTILQYSGERELEIRDQTTIYCAGINQDYFDSEEIFPGSFSEYESFIPTKEDRASHYVAHFSGSDFEGLYSLNTFSIFSPSKYKIETEYDTITSAGNPMEGSPKFFLESLPSKDKVILYKEWSKWVNPGQPPELFDVSVDMITGDGTILQRWNFVDCKLFDYGLRLEENRIKFRFAEEKVSEIRDKSDIACNGLNLEVPRDGELEKYPIKASQVLEEFDTYSILDDNNTAQTFTATFSGGDLETTYIGKGIHKFETITRDRGSLTPLHHAKQYDYGFFLESLPNKDRIKAYKFYSEYLNELTDPEPFDVKINTIAGDGTTLYAHKYSNCEGVDLVWYLQDLLIIYPFSQDEGLEIREKYIYYCEGLLIEFP